MLLDLHNDFDDVNVSLDDTDEGLVVSVTHNDRAVADSSENEKHVFKEWSEAKKKFMDLVENEWNAVAAEHE